MDEVAALAAVLSPYAVAISPPVTELVAIPVVLVIACVDDGGEGDSVHGV